MKATEPDRRHEQTPSQRAASLKERVYISFTALAVVLALSSRHISDQAETQVGRGEGRQSLICDWYNLPAKRRWTRKERAAAAASISAAVAAAFPAGVTVGAASACRSPAADGAPARMPHWCRACR